MPNSSPRHPPPSRTTSRQFNISSGVQQVPQRIGIFGGGGIGKTTLARSLSSVHKKPLIVDLDEGSSHLPVHRISHIEVWDDLRSVLGDKSLSDGYDVLVVDSVTRAQDLCAAAIMKKEGVRSLELAGGGYGKGYRFLYENMLTLLSDLERHVWAGRHVLLIMHEFVARVPNPMGQDFIRFEPNLYASEKVSVRHRVKEWLDHLLFVGYDVFTRDGKARGTGTRTIYPQELPTHWAKSRKLSSPIPFTSPDDCTLWKQLFSQGTLK